MRQNGRSISASAGSTAGYISTEPQGRSRLRLRPVRRAQPHRAFLPIHQTVPRHRDPLRKNRAQCPRRPAFGLHPGLAQMRTRPNTTRVFETIKSTGYAAAHGATTRLTFTLGARESNLGSAPSFQPSFSLRCASAADLSVAILQEFSKWINCSPVVLNWTPFVGPRVVEFKV